MTFSFSFSVEQEELRASVRKFLAQYSSSKAVRALIASTAGYDDDVWRQMADQMGLPSLAIPEEYGGSGFGPADIGIVPEEAGRALLCSPYFATVALAGEGITGWGDEPAKRRWLPAIASGDLTATLAVAEEPGSWDLAEIATRATQKGDGWVLEGTKTFVIDGHTADLLLVIARTESGGLGLFAVVGDAASPRRQRPEAPDPTPRPSRPARPCTAPPLAGAAPG